MHSPFRGAMPGACGLRLRRRSARCAFLAFGPIRRATAPRGAKAINRWLPGMRNHRTPFTPSDE